MSLRRFVRTFFGLPIRLSPRGSTIAGAREGELVLLSGRAGGASTLVAPYSRRPCLAYSIEVDAIAQDPQHRRWARTLCKEENDQELTLHDATGVAILGRSWRRWAMPWEMIKASPAPAEFGQWLATHAPAGELARHTELKGWFVVSEQVLSLGATLRVIGLAQWSDASAGGPFRGDSSARTLELIGNRDVPLAIEVLSPNSK